METEATRLVALSCEVVIHGDWDLAFRSFEPDNISVPKRQESKEKCKNKSHKHGADSGWEDGE